MIRASLAKPLLWAVFVLYILLLSYTMAHHELWGDELHSWNIAKASTGFTDLMANARYEGHPPVWYIILWSISKLTHHLMYVQAMQWIIAVGVVFMVLFLSSLPLVTRILLPFGYYFLFEYAAFSRNYGVGVLLAFGVCLILHSHSRYKLLLYYILLFLLSNTHLLATLLAGSLHLYFLLSQRAQKKKAGILIIHIVLGIFILLPALYFVFPPSDSSLNLHFFMSRWHARQQLAMMIQAPLKAFMPIPACWRYHFWNTQCLLDAQQQYTLLKFVTPLVSITLLALVFFVLKRSKKSVALFAVNLLLTFAIAAIFPLSSTRYVGFIYIGFIVAYWLYTAEMPAGSNKNRLVNLLLVMQLAGAAIAVSKDVKYPFSNAYRVNELLKEVPANEKVVTDYWCLNMLAAYADKPFYCIDLGKEMSFLMWTKEFTAITKKENLYCNGMKTLFQREGLKHVYMITIHSPQDVKNADPKFLNVFHMQLVDKREHAIEKGSNLYLYKISAF